MEGIITFFVVFHFYDLLNSLPYQQYTPLESQRFIKFPLIRGFGNRN
jgi:hypothetical protein